MRKKVTQVQYDIASDSTPLHWQEYIIQDGNIHPAVIFLPGGGFRKLLSIPFSIPNDILALGYNVFTQTQYRIAPPNKIPGQVSLGRFPDQTNDVQLAAAAAAADTRCNGEVFVIGGSAGASHAAYLAANSFVKAAVSLSPAMQFDDPVSLQQDATFRGDVNNYSPGNLPAASPNNMLVSAESPLFIAAFSQDHMPGPQYDLAVAKLESLGAPYESTLIPGSGHSWDCWPFVRDQVVAFLNAHRAI